MPSDAYKMLWHRIFTSGKDKVNKSMPVQEASKVVPIFDFLPKPFLWHKMQPQTTSCMTKMAHRGGIWQSVLIFRNDSIANKDIFHIFAAEIVSGLWCNGNTSDSGPDFPGSNPGSPTQAVERQRSSHRLFFTPAQGFLPAVPLKKTAGRDEKFIFSLSLYVCRLKLHRCSLNLYGFNLNLEFSQRAAAFLPATVAAVTVQRGADVAHQPRILGTLDSRPFEQAAEMLLVQPLPVLRCHRHQFV